MGWGGGGGCGCGGVGGGGGVGSVPGKALQGTAQFRFRVSKDASLVTA